MPKWLSVVLVIIIFFVVAGFVERRRVGAMDAWRRARGFTEINPFVPADRGHVQTLASTITDGDPKRLQWASVITGTSGNARVTFAEVSYSPSGRKTSVWFTLAVWPEENARGPLVFATGGKSVVGEFARAVTTAMGVATERPVSVMGSLVVNGEPEKWKPWLTARRQHALENWPQGESFGLSDGYAGFLSEGLLTPDRADQLLARIAAVRREIE